MIRHVETIIVGGGQAGLATSYCFDLNQVRLPIFDEDGYAGQVAAYGRH